MTVCLVRKAKAVPELMSPLTICAAQAKIAIAMAVTAMMILVLASPIFSSMKFRFVRHTMRRMERQPALTQMEMKARQ